MISAELIREFLNEELTARGLFLVEVSLRPGNKITVFIDSFQGVTLDECISVTRFIESRIDRNVEDYELEVSSPGLDKPLKIPQQYEKNIGRMLDVVKSDGTKITGKLLGISREMITLETQTVVRDSKTKKKKTELNIRELKMEEIKAAKIVISLKK